MAEAPGKKKKLKNARKLSALKRVRQSGKRALHNRGMLTKMRNQIKALKKELVSKNKSGIEKLLKPTLSTIAKMATKRIIHHNTAARYASRIMQQFQKSI